MFRNLSATAAWGLLAFIAYATLAPIEHRPSVSHSAGFEHLAAYVLLGLLFFAAYPRRLLLVFMIVLGSAVLLELLQELTADRHARILDAVQKLAGGALGVFAGQVGLYLLSRLNFRAGA